DKVVLLIVEEDDYESVKARRDRDTEALFPVEPIVTPEREQDLWVAMGCPSGVFNEGTARYSSVCLVTAPNSQLHSWGVAFFANSMRPLVERGGLFTCPPPFRREVAQPVLLDENPP
ncbi:MAG: hypothetical protein ACREA0_34705, partial [bacterium]